MVRSALRTTGVIAFGFVLAELLSSLLLDELLDRLW